MFRTFKVPIPWTELIKRTGREFLDDNCLGLAAQLAYYMILAFVPALVFLIALTSFLPADAIDRLLSGAAAVMPADILNVLREQMREIGQGQHGGLLTFGFLFALWSSSAAVVAVADALNRAYDIEEGRAWWKVRLTAILLTIGLAILVLLAMALLLVGPAVAEWLSARMGYGAAFEWTWKIAQWPVVFLLVAFGIALLNYFGPDADQDWTWISPGAVVATGLWLLASLGFKLYLANFADYNETYGSLGGAIVLLLWFYISGLAILAGAEMNAEIEHASPHGKDPGEKVPGQRKKLGARAAREFEQRQRGTGAAPRTPPAISSPFAQPAPQSAWSGWVSGAAMFLLTRFVRRRSRD